MNKLIYCEYVHPIKDYFSTLRLNEAVFDWVLPLIISVLLFVYPLSVMDDESIKVINGYSINLLAILVGFSITSLTILTANSSKNIEDLKGTSSERVIRGRKVNLYHLIVLNFIFLLIMEFISLLYCFTFLLAVEVAQFKDLYKEIFIVSVYLIFHVVFLNVRNVTNFYFIVSREE